ncbi:MAG: cell division topological specificity factor MinE [Deltaproteobacteria bacterium]|nr:cell division topological specificity factor MinE [Deltaproteobacteria bacterium]
MRILEFLRSNRKKSAAQTAKERLQIILAHERAGTSGKDFLPLLHKELVAVICKYVNIDEDKVEVKLDRGGEVSTLEVNIELPSIIQPPPPQAVAHGI